MIQLTGAGKRYGPKILFQDADWLVTPNEPEATRFAGQHTTPAHIAALLAHRWSAAVAITLGSRGAVLGSTSGIRTIPVPGASRCRLATTNARSAPAAASGASTAASPPTSSRISADQTSTF